MGERQTTPLTWGAGLDRATGVAAVNPVSWADLRNVHLLDGTAEVRRGLQRAASLLLDGSGVAMTDVVAIAPLRGKRSSIVVAYEQASGKVQLYETPGPTGGFGAPVCKGTLWTLTAGQAWNTNATRVFVAEGYSKFFVAVATTYAGVGGAQVTRYYDPAAANTGPGTQYFNLPNQASLTDIKFLGVTQHRGYLVGWGFGADGDTDRGELIRISLPGQPTVFNKEHYLLAGARGEPVVNCVSIGNELLAFKESSIHAVVGSNRANFGVFPRDHIYGLAGHRLAVNANGVCYFWSHQGPRVTTGGPSEEIGIPLALQAPEPADLQAMEALWNGFAVYDRDRLQVRFVFGRRCYVLHLRNPGNPRWSYEETSRTLISGGDLYGPFSHPTPSSTATGSRLQRYMGQAGGNGVFQTLFVDGTVGVHQDDGVAFQARALSDPVAPAGLHGECIFPAFWLTVTHTMAVTLRVTPYVDGVALETRDIALTTKATLTTETFELGLTVPLGGSRSAPRGARFAAKVETLVGGAPSIATGDLRLDQSLLEYEVVRETRQAA